VTPVPRPDLSRDQLRRELRDAAATAPAANRAAETAMRAMLDSTATAEERTAAVVGRRRFLTIGGASIATAALVAACAEDPRTGIARVGVAPSTTKLPDAVVDDVVLLRTASSLEHSAIAVYEAVIGHTDLLDAAYQDVAKRFRDDHAGHAALFEKLTTEAGGTAWTVGNPRIDQVVLAPILRAILGGPKTDLLPETPASDDIKRDVLNLAHALETLAGETYQALVPIINDAAARKEAITIGTHEVRHAALLAMAITGKPGGYFAPSDIAAATLETPPTVAPATTVKGASPSTPIPTVYSVPSVFALLGQVQLVVGKPNDAGTRLTTNLETPSLNTFVYEYMTPSK
jgi:rubrerythrin